MGIVRKRTSSRSPQKHTRFMLIYRVDVKKRREDGELALLRKATTTWGQMHSITEQSMRNSWEIFCARGEK